MKSAIRPEIWRRAQTGHMASWRVYAENGRRDSPERREYWRHILLATERQAPIEPGEAILDIGCGINTVFDFVSDVRGYTLDSLMARIAGLGLSERAHHVAGVFENIPFRDCCFDRVFAMNMLDHVRDPAAGLRETARVLRPGGTLVLSVDTYESRKYHEKRARKWWDRVRGASTKHPWVFSAGGVRSLLRATGFESGAPAHLPGSKARRAFFTARRP